MGWQVNDKWMLDGYAVKLSFAYVEEKSNHKAYAQPPELEAIRVEKENYVSLYRKALCDNL